MTGLVALTHEQGQDLAVLSVKRNVIGDPSLRQQMVAFGAQTFGMATVLLGEDGRTWGRPDIVRWLGNVDPRRLPWRRFTV